VARQAVITLIKSLGQYKPFGGRTVLIAYFFVILGKLVEKNGRTIALLWLMCRHRQWLRADTDGWASMGYALLSLRCYRLTVWWMRDWRERANLQGWMLFNLALAEHECRHRKNVREILDRAVRLPERDDVFQKTRLLLALELALSGKTEAAARHFHEINPTGWGNYLRLKYRLTRGLLAVQQAEAGAKLDAFRSERAAIRQEMAAQHCSTMFHFDYRRTLIRMAKDTGSRWAVISSSLSF
jgi:hypothetical protein